MLNLIKAKVKGAAELALPVVFFTSLGLVIMWLDSSYALFPSPPPPAPVYLHCQPLPERLCPHCSPCAERTDDAEHH